MSGGDFSDVTQVSWFSRIGNAFFGILIGLLMFLASFVILWWNEGNAVTEARSLAEGKKSVVSIDAAVVNPDYDGKLVHLTAKATTEEKLTDPLFGLSQPQSLQLFRTVEMYQWQEKIEEKRERQIGGGEKIVKTPKYTKVWSTTPINSSSFRDQAKVNPAMPLQGATFTADKVTVGAFRLPKELVTKIGGEEERPLSEAEYKNLSDDRQQQFQRVAEGYLYSQNVGGQADSPTATKADPNLPQIGDLRVKFLVVKPTVVSLVAQQNKDTFAPYLSQVGREIEMIQRGEHSAAEMFADAERMNDLFCWILRGVGWLVMGIGIYLMFKPLVVLVDVLPFLGNIVGFGVFLVAALMSLVLSLITIALAWVFYRPVVGLSILAVAALVFGLFWYFGKKKSSAKPTATA